MTALYQLAAEYRQAADRLQQLDLDEVTIADTLENLSGDLEVKSVNTMMVVRNLETLADSIKQAEDAMAVRRKSVEARAERIRAYVLENMLACNISKIESPYFELAVRDNPPSVVIDCAAEIPAEFLRQPEMPPPAIDKKLIASVIKDGFCVPGAHLEHGKRLAIK